MRHGTGLALAVFLLVAAGAGQGLAQTPDEGAPRRLFNLPNPFAAAKPTEPKKKDAAEPKRTPSAVEIAAQVQAEETAKLLRRLRVCDRLREIAYETGDAKLERLADQLDQRANDLYRVRTAALSADGPPTRETDDDGRAGARTPERGTTGGRMARKDQE